MKNSIFIIPIFLLLILLQGCYTPATFQNAKLIPPKQMEITPTFTMNNPMTKHKTHFGFVFKYGLNEKKNLLFRYSYIDIPTAKAGGFHYFGIGGKIPWIKDKLAFSDYAGFYLNDPDFEGSFFEYKPSVIWTIYDNDNLEFNLSVNTSINLWNDDKDNIYIMFGYINLNFCPAFSTDFSKYSIRPLLGWSSYAWRGFDSSRLYQGISFSYKF